MGKYKVIQGEIINLTPHEVVLLEPDSFRFEGVEPKVKKRFPPSKTPARCKAKSSVLMAIQMGDSIIEVTSTRYFRVENLPPEEPGRFYIVSKLVADVMLLEREDLLVLSSLLRARGENGRVIGGRSLAKFQKR